MSKDRPVRIFAGHRVRALRRQLALSQRAMAERLDVSISYLSQIESGDRPVTEGVLGRLAAQFPADWASVDEAESSALLVRALAACEDPSVGDAVADPRDIERLVRQHAPIARRLTALYDALRQREVQLSVLDDRIEGNADGSSRRMPWEEVRDWFHAEQNYVDAIDRRAEVIGAELPGPRDLNLIEGELARRFGVRVERVSSLPMLRDYDPAARVLRVDAGQAPETTLFSLAYQLALLEFSDLIEVMARGQASSDAARQLLMAGLANYAAGALLMPYRAFRDAARALRHDVDRLRQRFGTSFEQTCHRLSTLQRPGALGVPVFFCRVDMAGNITKRHSATPLQFARFGGACPLWIVHEAVAIPDRILVQLAETPDGVRYVSMAKGLVKPSGGFDRPPRRYAVALGCEADHAGDFIYADALSTHGAATPIGTSCRICPRARCEQRAFPPAAAGISLNPHRRRTIPYDIV